MSHRQRCSAQDKARRRLLFSTAPQHTCVIRHTHVLFECMHQTGIRQSISSPFSALPPTNSPVRKDDAPSQKRVRPHARDPFHALYQGLINGLAPKLLHQLVVVDLAIAVGAHVPGRHDLPGRNVVSSHDGSTKPYRIDSVSLSSLETCGLPAPWRAPSRVRAPRCLP